MPSDFDTSEVPGAPQLNPSSAEVGMRWDALQGDSS